MLKKISKIIVLALACLTVILPVTVSASESTTYTYTISVDGKWIRTQDAYMPSEILFGDAGLEQPSDIFIKGDLIYVADSGNGRIVVRNLITKEQKIIGEGILQQPSGIFVTSKGEIFVADLGKKNIMKLSSDGRLVQTIKRPSNSPLFSKNTVFEPKNVVVTSQGNIFAVGVGAHEGIMQFSDDGEFQGFFAANKRDMSFLERIQDFIFTEEQKEQLLNRTSRPIENIDISDVDLICSVTQDAGFATAWRAAEEKIENRIKYHNMAGVNIMSAEEDIFDEWNFVDVAAGPDGLLYAMTYTGIINEYDSQGNLLFSFGGRAVSTDRNGLFTMGAAIDLDSQGYIYALDKERGLVQVFYPTEYAHVTHEAISILESGNYEDSEELWKYILSLNGMSQIAHIGYGKSLFHQQRFDEALAEFKIANDKEGYSDAFWEIRNKFFNKSVPWLICGLVVLYIIFKVFKLMLRKKQTDALVKKEANTSLLMKSIKDVFGMLRHPLDTLYDLKKGTKGSVLSATVLYVLLTVVFVADMLFRGFLFSGGNLADTSIVPVLIMFVVPAFLWVIGNTMVASINEGEGSFKNIYICTAYSLAPYLVFAPAVVFISYGVTFNESFILEIVWFVGVAWSAALLFLSTMHTHDYTVMETVKNILLTVFFMLMAVVAVSIMYLMWDQLIVFVKSLIGEGMFRATN